MKPVLPTLNLARVLQIQAEDNAASLPAPSLPPSYSGTRPRLSRQRSALHASQACSSSSNSAAADCSQEASRRTTCIAGTSKPSVPMLNLANHNVMQVGFGTSGGIDASVSARGLHSSQQQQQLMQQISAQREASTARAAASSEAVTSRTLQHAEAQPQQGEAEGPAEAADRADQSDESDSDVAWDSGALTQAKAVKRYSEFLTPFELNEIRDFPQVFFVGRSGAPKVQGSVDSGQTNFGYDDDRGEYIVTPHDHLAYRYEILSVLGRGSFGQVLKCHDFLTNRMYAIKIIRNKKRFQYQALVEPKVLQQLVEQDPQDSYNVVHMHDSFMFRNHLCIAFELLSINLYEFIKQNNFMGISTGLIRRFAQQMLVSLAFMKELNIVHCDLKPENVMLKSPNRSMIKIIDFGSSCMASERLYTYIQSRFYRAPEILLGLPYGTAIDMWSFGCILAELCMGYPLFPGEDEGEQLLCIMEMLDVPSSAVLDQATRLKLFFDPDRVPRITPNSHGKVRSPGTKALAGILKCSDAPFLDLLQRCFVWDPQERITPEQALHHPWITERILVAPAPPLTQHGMTQPGIWSASVKSSKADEGTPRRLSSARRSILKQSKSTASNSLAAHAGPVEGVIGGSFKTPPHWHASRKASVDVDAPAAPSGVPVLRPMLRLSLMGDLARQLSTAASGGKKPTAHSPRDASSLHQEHVKGALLPAQIGKTRHGELTPLTPRGQDATVQGSGIWRAGTGASSPSAMFQRVDVKGCHITIMAGSAIPPRQAGQGAKPAGAHKVPVIEHFLPTLSLRRQH